jgi:hypothetical protein
MESQLKMMIHFMDSLHPSSDRILCSIAENKTVIAQYVFAFRGSIYHMEEAITNTPELFDGNFEPLQSLVGATLMLGVGVKVSTKPDGSLKLKKDTKTTWRDPYRVTVMASDGSRSFVLEFESIFLKSFARRSKPVPTRGDK